MYRISELAEKVGLSRSTLLYYEKLGLLQGVRQTNGYRLYSDKDVQQLHLLLQLQAGGLTLKEYKSFLDSKVQRSVLEKRLTQIRQAGFDVIDHFTMSEQAWHDYYRPLKARVADVKVSMPNSTAIADLEQEIAIYERDLGEFGYQMFVLRKGA
ncbi:MerR family transcriptional regulator [Vibrio vulnificus]